MKTIISLFIISLLAGCAVYPTRDGHVAVEPLPVYVEPSIVVVPRHERYYEPRYYPRYEHRCWGRCYYRR